MAIRAANDPFSGTQERPSIEKVRDMLLKSKEHKESIDKMSPDFRVFEGCSFPAHCRDLKWNRNGTMIIPLEVAFRYISLAENMIYSSGVPLAVHIERYSPLTVMGNGVLRGDDKGDADE